MEGGSILEELEIQSVLKEIPSVNVLLEKQEVKAIIGKYSKQIVLEKLREIIDQFRKTPSIYKRDRIIDYIIDKLNETMDVYQNMKLKKVINATGIVLHTNLGRAPLPKEAIEHMVNIAEGYSNLEYDLEEGNRGSRYSHIEPMLKKITGAEGAMVINNNAAAVFLCLNTLASYKEVIISRGQQVEIGGSFRIPDIIARSSAKMVEVGTTNKTKILDYSNVISDETAVLLKVHTSNYKITGFTEDVSLEKLAEVGKVNKLIVMEDLGSGSLYDLSQIGLPYEPTVQDSIKNGADIVTFSGDKLLGGPQAGIIVGKKELINKIKQNPITRMLRCDKLTLAALASILNLYLDIDKVDEKIPVIKMMSLKEAELMVKASELEGLIKNKLSNKYYVEICDDLDEVGGGSLPNVILKGKAVAISSNNMNVNELQERLRKGNIPIICHIKKDKLLLNVRTIQENEFNIIADKLSEIAGD